jgi:hypothetical protein
MAGGGGDGDGRENGFGTEPGLLSVTAPPPPTSTLKDVSSRGTHIKVSKVQLPSWTSSPRQCHTDTPILPRNETSHTTAVTPRYTTTPGNDSARKQQGVRLAQTTRGQQAGTRCPSTSTTTVHV